MGKYTEFVKKIVLTETISTFIDDANNKGMINWFKLKLEHEPKLKEFVKSGSGIKKEDLVSEDFQKILSSVKGPNPINVNSILDAVNAYTKIATAIVSTFKVPEDIDKNNLMKIIALIIVVNDAIISENDPTKFAVAPLKSSTLSEVTPEEYVDELEKNFGLSA